MVTVTGRGDNPSDLLLKHGDFPASHVSLLENGGTPTKINMSPVSVFFVELVLRGDLLIRLY